MINFFRTLRYQNGIVHREVIHMLSIVVFIFIGCKQVPKSNPPVEVDKNVAAANAFIDAFYSFNPNKLQDVLVFAEESQPAILYYQGWAEGGNYEVVNRAPVQVKNDSMMVYPVTVKDDLIGALELTFNVTDTFHIKAINGRILSVDTSSNDPELYHEAKAWVQENRPELIESPCEGIWDGGPTPGDCVRAMVQGYAEFLATKKEQ